MLSITRKELRALRPCKAESRMALFVDDTTPLTAQEALEKGVSLPDLLWVAARLGHLDLCVRFAVECARTVAHLNPDLGVEAALGATQAWLDNPCTETADAARAAADAARAAYAADVARVDTENRSIFISIFCN